MKNTYFQNPHLDGNTFYMTGNKVGVLLLHGFTSTTIEVRGLAEFLNQSGLAISAPLLPGHGTQPKDMLKINWRDWTATAENALLDLKNQFDYIIVGGESLGGLLSLYLAKKYPDIKGVALFAPALSVKGIWRAPILSPFIKIRPKGYGGADQDGHLPWQGYTAIPVPAANQLRLLQKVTLKSLKDIRNPIVIFQGLLDHTINPQSSQIIFDRISSNKKELFWLKNTGHCVILDIEREYVYQKFLDFIQQVI